MTFRRTLIRVESLLLWRRRAGRPVRLLLLTHEGSEMMTASCDEAKSTECTRPHKIISQILADDFERLTPNSPSMNPLNSSSFFTAGSLQTLPNQR